MDYTKYYIWGPTTNSLYANYEVFQFAISCNECVYLLYFIFTNESLHGYMHGDLTKDLFVPS